MIRAYGRFAIRPSGHLTGAHDRFLRLLSQSLEQTPAGALTLLMNQILEHLERIHPTRPSAAPDHAKLPGALSTKISRRTILTLLLENLHTSRSDSAILTDHLKNLSSNTMFLFPMPSCS
jgi:hypothetical protein